MQITPTNPLSPLDPLPVAIAGRPAARFDAAGSFREALGKAAWDNQERKAPEVEAREAAERLVSSAFIQPILESLREMNNAAPPFGPTQGEKQFAPLLDAQLADRYVAAQNFPLVDRIAQQLLQRGGAA